MANYSGQNTINGSEGSVFLDSDELAEVQSLTATLTKTKSDVRIMGRRFNSHKVSGVNGTGTLTLYKATSRFIQYLLEYAHGGQDRYFTVQTKLDDKTAGRGTERVTLYGVNFDSVQLSNLNVATESLTEELPFTFEDCDLPQSLSSMG